MTAYDGYLLDVLDTTILLLYWSILYIAFLWCGHIWKVILRSLSHCTMHKASSWVSSDTRQYRGLFVLVYLFWQHTVVHGIECRNAVIVYLYTVIAWTLAAIHNAKESHIRKRLAARRICFNCARLQCPVLVRNRSVQTWFIILFVGDAAYNEYTRLGFSRNVEKLIRFQVQYVY